MLKIQKLSLAALMVSAVVSGSVFAEDKAAPSASDASYAVGALMGNNKRKPQKKKAINTALNLRKKMA